MRHEGKPGSGVGSPPRPKHPDSSNSNPYSGNGNRSLPLELSSIPPVIEAVLSQLSDSQLKQFPKFIELTQRLGSDEAIAADCQSFADEFGEAVVIFDRDGRVLAFRTPQTG